MTRLLDSLSRIADRYDAVVLDQWGVLHDGSTLYPSVLSCLDALKRAGHQLAVLSNSGKRAAPNAARIADMGLHPHLFAKVMTSGEALWRDIAAGRIPARSFLAIERAPGDARAWAQGLDVTIVDDLSQADAVLLMGLPDGASLNAWRDALEQALARDLTVYCSNPDQASPRAGGLVLSPGALAIAFRDMGGDVIFYGKPHKPIFAALKVALGASRLLMVGDSLEHDIAGAQAAGWDSVLIQGGLYASDFAGAEADAVLDGLVTEKGVRPTYRMEILQ
ncbi:MAG: TIGR01459 family HAD-type hydrolase [Pseudomonadota bacterium]